MYGSSSNGYQMIRQFYTGYITKRIESRDTTGICTFMFIATLFTVTERWEQPKYLLTDEWINKKWYVHIMEYYSA